jgi:xanthine dehydrogenase YagR molybdenum-binding subunit
MSAGIPAPAGPTRLGTPVSRVDGRLKVTGQARYAADNNLPGLTYGYLLQATIARGTITAMDTGPASRAPGVLAVFTPFNPLKLFAVGGLFGDIRVPLQDAEVHYYGQVIGMVVAETFEQARDAAGLVRASYREQPAQVSFADHLTDAVAPAQVNGEPATVTVLADGVPSIDAALAASEVRVSGTYQIPVRDHAAMEPHAAVAAWRDGHLTVYSATQAPTDHARSIATALGLDGAKVHVLNPFVGGAFGGKYVTAAHTLLAAAAARALDRPVKAVLTREQVFLVIGHRTSTAQAVTLGANRDGTLLAVRHQAISALSNSANWYDAPAHAITRSLHAAANFQLEQQVVRLDRPPTTIMRAPAEEPGAFAIETAMDELAAALRMDPVDLRLRNYSSAQQGTGLPWSSKHLDECYREGAWLFGWAGRDPTPRSHVDGDWLVGTGMAACAYPALRFPSSAKVRFQADGTAVVSTATSDAGTGMWTALAIIGADRLGLPLRQVRPDIGDSALPDSFGAGGSAGTVSAAGAVDAAAAAAVEALLQLAATSQRSPFHGHDPATLTYRNGTVVGPGRSVDFGTLLSTVDVPGVEATESVAPGANSFAIWSFGAHFCQVRVNRWTGEPRLIRMLAVIDAGTIVNPITARNQVLGSLVWGIGHALLEGTPVEDTGRFANATFADYLLPVNADIPTLDVHFLDHPDPHFPPNGGRGIGELGLVGAAAAIGNAVYHATGRRIRDLPITLDKLLD